MHPILKKYFALIKRFMPEKPKGTTIGLDISSCECRFVELAKIDETFKIVNWAVEKIEKGNTKEALTKLTQRFSSPKATIYSSVFGKGTLIRYIDLPRMSQNDLNNSFALEADKYFPFSSDQIYSDCHILDPQGKGKQMSVLAAAATKEIIDNRIKLFKEAEMNVEFIGLNPIAIANVFNTIPEAKQETLVPIALLDMGENITSLTIISEGLPKFTRDIFMGSQDLLKRIANALGMGVPEVFEIIRNPGEMKGEILKACESALQSIIQEIKLSFDYFTTEKNNEIHSLLFTGEGALISGIDENLGKNLDIKVKKWDPLKIVGISEEIKSADLEKNSMKLAVALGLALYDYD